MNILIVIHIWKIVPPDVPMWTLNAVRCSHSCTCNIRSIVKCAHIYYYVVFNNKHRGVAHIVHHNVADPFRVGKMFSCWPKWKNSRMEWTIVTNRLLYFMLHRNHRNFHCIFTSHRFYGCCRCLRPIFGQHRTFAVFVCVCVRACATTDKMHIKFSTSKSSPLQLCRFSA